VKQVARLMNEQKSLNYFDKIGLFIIGLSFGFSLGVAISSWDWFPEETWWYNPLARIPQSNLNFFALVAPLIVLGLFLIVRRKVFKSENI